MARSARFKFNYEYSSGGVFFLAKRSNMQGRIAFGCATLAALTIILVLSFPGAAQAQLANTARPLITEKVSDANTITLFGNTRPEAVAANDRGALAPDAPIEHMLLQLKRSPEQEQALSKFIDELHTPGSPNYHNWITAHEFGQRFGLAPQDLAAITGWLESHGFAINVVYPSGMAIDFSGSAGQVREAFGTEIHGLDVNGVRHFANFGDPTIPAALSPAVVGIVSLHDFSPHAMHKMHGEYTFTSGNQTFQAVVPSDLATIYNLNPLFNNGISGQGQTVVVIEDTNVFSTADWTTFRSTFGLSSFTSGSFTQVHPAPPTGTNNCGNPGVNGDDSEAILDAEYASAAAPSATIELASCSDTSTFGGLIALQNLLNESAMPPAVVSISYGECEAINGASANAAYNSAYSLAVTEGVSIFVSAGDEGAASCDANQSNATHGIGVSGFASTPFNVAVGGTDFGDTFAGTNSTYWNSTNTATFGSAKSYVPEIPWDDSCAGALVSSFEGFATPYGSAGFCNSTTGANFRTTGSGSGGPSGCATGSASTSGVVSGSCAGWAKPSWQTLVGVPSDGVRDLPDVSLFSSNGFWGHYFVFCYSDTQGGGTPCTGAPSGWAGAGGTSFASPILAGIQALVNQKTGSRQGNPNPTYYSLAATEYGGSGNASCNSTLGNGVSSACIFYDVKQGDMDVNCTGTHNCFLPSGTFGVLSTSNTAYAPAYGTTTGWDFATGIGTVNVANLVNAWPGSSSPNFTISPSPSSVTITQGGTGGTSTISVAPTNGFSGSVTFSATGLPSGVTAAFSPNPSTSSTTLTLTASTTAATGTASITISGVSGSLTHTTSVSLTVNGSPNFSLSASPTSVTIVQGATGGTSTITVTPQNGFSGSVTMAASGLPTGVTAAFSPNPATATSTLTLTASGTATTGAATVTITGTSGSLTHTTAVSLTVNPAPNFSLAASPTSVTIAQGGAGGSSTVTITRLNGFTSSVTMSASGLPSGVTAAFSPNPGTTTSKLTLTASGNATLGTATVTITGTSGSLTHTTTVGLTVNATPNFTLSASPTSVSIARGGSGTSTITVTPSSGFTGSVTLAASGLPGGVTAAFSPNPATSTSTLTLKASAFAGASSSTVTITGTSGSLSHTTTVSLTVTTTGTANFSLAASPSSVTIAKGGAGGTTTVTVTRLNGFTSGVTLAASGLPTGVTAAFSPNPATTTSTLTLTASSTATTGTSTVTITGTSGSLTHTATVSLTVNAAASPDFSLGASPSSVTITKGGAGGTSTITITRLDGFTGSVTMAASGLPTGVTAAFSPNPATTSSTLTLTASSTATTGTVTVTITGTSGSLTHTATVRLTVNAAASGDFTLSASPTSVSIARGSHGATTVTITPSGGFTGAVTLSATGMAAGTTAAFGTNPATGSSTLTFTPSSTATTGAVTVTITGTSGSLTHTTTVTLTIRAGVLL
jgi:hypothetical protein